MDIIYHPIGIIHSPLASREGAPFQGRFAPEVRGRIEVFPEYEEGLLDIEGFSHLIILYHFHRSQGFDLKVTPFLDDREHGVFAVRAPKRAAWQAPGQAPDGLDSLSSTASATAAGAIPARPRSPSDISSACRMV